MTIYGLIASLAWTATAVLFVERSHGVASRWLANHAPQDPRADRPEIPDDLLALAMEEDAGSLEATRQAQQSVIDAIYASWRQYKDWNKVRAAMGVGTR